MSSFADKGLPEEMPRARRRSLAELFRDSRIPKRAISVNAENGVVFLRGEVEDRAWIERLGADAGAVEGVKAVRNLLHVPGTPAPAAPGTH
jgi:hypothetical protein